VWVFVQNGATFEKIYALFEKIYALFEKSTRFLKGRWHPAPTANQVLSKKNKAAGYGRL
jgi:hypothetical protein